MKKHLVFLLFAVLTAATLASCTKNADNTHFPYNGPCHCGVDNPLDDLEWLHQNVLLFELWRGKQDASIAVCTFDSVRQGFIINPCVHCDDGMSTLVDCEGHEISMLGGIAGITYNIDPSSVRIIYCNYPDTVPTLTGKRWHLQRFVDRTTNPWTEEVPTGGNGPISFWLQFYEDGTLLGGGINQLQGQYYLDPEQTYRFYYTHVESVTEIYDQTGWEERLIAALNSATEYAFSDYGGRMRIYYDQNRKFLEFTLEE
jgi:hypothetical protein